MGTYRAHPRLAFLRGECTCLLGQGSVIQIPRGSSGLVGTGGTHSCHVCQSRSFHGCLVDRDRSCLQHLLGSSNPQHKCFPCLAALDCMCDRLDKSYNQRYSLHKVHRCKFQRDRLQRAHLSRSNHPLGMEQVKSRPYQASNCTLVDILHKHWLRLYRAL